MINSMLAIIEQSMLHLPLIYGAYISFSLLKVPDLSIESAYVVGAIMGTSMLKYAGALPTPLGLIVVIGASLIGGAMVGLTSSILTQMGKLPHLLSSIITFGLFHGINQLLSPVYVSLTAMPNPLISECITTYPELPIIIILASILITGMFLLLRTQIGYSYAVYGNNPQFFSNYFISTPYVFISGIMLANALAGLSGYLFAQSNNFFELNIGIGKALLCITALILGKGILHTKKPSSFGIPLVGTLAYFGIQQLLLKIGFDLKYFTAVQALIVLGILLYRYHKNPGRQTHDNLGV